MATKDTKKKLKKNKNKIKKERYSFLQFKKRKLY
jgi:hypothetical protein